MHSQAPPPLPRFLDGLENLPEATVICDIDGGILVANRRAVALAPAMLSGIEDLAVRGGGTAPGASPDSPDFPDFADDAYGGLAPPGLPDLIEALFPVPGPGLAYWDALCAVLDSHAPVMSSDDSQGVELATEDDRRFLLHGAPLQSESGRPPGAIVSLIDITTVRRAERQRAQMLHFLSHDMRSPQASILALIDMQSRPTRALPPDVLLARIAEHAHRTLALADDFIRLAQADSERLEFAEVELTGLVLDATDELWALAKARGIELQLSLEAEGETLRAAPVLLVRAIANLVSNAIKFGPPGKPVSVRLRRMGLFLAVAVSDSGPGISYADQARLFEPFRRVHAPGADAPAGSGLGLVFVKTVAERHGGRVMVDSAAGAGATFTLLLPLRRRAG
ncbi:Adaptive-response sensory-kinase SasA [Cupriavidus campinensis]|nr:Adaptive-response sensory-kinase SasA [Cupriavidus campinensis]